MRGSRIILIAIILAFFLVFPSSAWLTGYSYRQVHNLTGSSSWGGNITNYPVKFIVNTSSGTSSGDTIYLNGNSESDLDDLRFTDVDGTELYYWIETKTNPYTVWVKVSTVYATGNTTIYSYYGNSGASASSSGINTFDLFDHFDSTGATTYNASYITSFSKSASNPLMRLGSQGWFGIMYNDYDSKFYLAIQNSTPGKNITMFSFDIANVTNAANWENHGVVYTATNAWEIYHVEPHSWVFESQTMADEREGVGAGLGTKQWRLYVCAESAYGTATLRWGFLTAPESDPTDLTHYSGNPISSNYIGDPKVVYYNGNVWVAQATYTAAGVTTDQDFYYSDDGVEGFSTTSRSWNTENIVEGQIAPFEDGWTQFGVVIDTGISEYFTRDGETKHAYASNPVVASGAAGAYDDQIFWNAIAIQKNNSVNIGGTYYLFYIGQNSTQDNLCLATSTTKTNVSVSSVVDPLLWQDLGGNSVTTSNLTITGASAAVRGIKTVATKTYGYNYSVREYTLYPTGSTAWFGFQNSVGNKYAGFSSYGTDHTETYNTGDQSINLPAAFSGWAVIEVFRNQTTNHKFYINDTLKNTHSTQVPTNTDMLVQSYTYGAVTKIIDWILVRKTYNIEPVHSDWQVEESSLLNADFTSNVTSGYPHFTVQFNDTSTGTPIDFEWIFDQGSSVDSTTRNATWNYTNVIGNTVTQFYVNFSADDGVVKSWENKSAYMTLYPLNASFNANITEGAAPLPVLFTDATDNGTATAWWWDFNEDDVVDDTNQTPTYTFTSSGLYNISLNVSNAYSWDWENKTDYVNVTSGCDPIDADFTSNVTEGYPEFAVQFTSTSTNATAWDWYFPNGGDSHTEVATWTFDYNIGNTVTTYNISLNASSSCDFEWENKTNYIVAYPLNASFSMNTTTGCNPLTVQFTDLTDNGTATSWNWSFDDGTYSDLQSPVHTFTSEDTFTVTLNASNLYSWDVEEKVDVITVTGSAPVSDFTANVTEGYPSFAVAFTDTSTGSPDAWDWNFGDGETDVVQNPEHTYDSVIGNDITTYTVSLNSSNTCGYDTEQKDDYITAYPLNASFGANITSGYQALPVQFTDYSDNGTATSWYYDFGDGNTCSTEQNPINIYTTTGGFTVYQNVSNAYSWDWENKTYFIQVDPNEIFSGFTANDTSGCGDGHSVQFTDLSTADGSLPTTWNWSFGDGNYSELQNPVYTYYGEGSYNVSLNASNAYTYDWTNLTNYITLIGSTPVAAFSGNVTEGYPPFAVIFTDASTNTPIAWDWDFGNGDSETVQNPTTTYNSVIGNVITSYTVYLNASNLCGYDWENKTDYITAYPLNASYGMNVTIGCSPLAVQFTDLSDNGTATNWNWSFDDGTYSDLQNPTHAFTDVRTYNITLNASNAYSWDIETKTNIIEVTGTAPVAGFTGNVTEGYPSFAVVFTDASNNTPTDWDWYVDGVKVSDLQNPEITFNDVIGNTITTYNIYLYSANACGGDWENATANITAYPLNASFAANVTSGDAPLVVGFTDYTDNGTPTTWWWDFNEDGVQDDANQSPTYIYATPGVYNVTLNASNAYSFDWLNLTDYITVNTPAAPPVAGFTANATSGYPNFTVQFTDTSTESPSDWDWYVDGVKVSDTQNLQYAFDDVIGNTITYYDIYLYAANGDGGDWENKSNYIVAYPLNASFSGNPTIGNSPLAVVFTDLTDNGTPAAWYWEFGDTGTGAIQNPGHTYNADGLYNVSLNASNTWSWDIEEKLYYINVTANYTPTPTPTTTTTVVVSGGQGTVSVSSATSGSGLTYPLIILGFGGIALVSVVGLVVFGIRRRRRNDEDDW